MIKPIVITNEGVTQIAASTFINTSAEKVWAVLKFPGRVKEFHPLIKDSYMISDQENGLGARRHCDLVPMGELEEVISEWNEGESITLEVIGGKMLPPYKFMRGHFQLAPDGAGTRVTFTFSYELKYGKLGRLMDILLIRPQFKKAPPKYVTGLKSYVERANDH